MDSTGDGIISEDEFLEALENPEVSEFLESLGMSKQEMQSLFSILDDGGGNISWEEFVEAIVRLKRAPRESDIISIERGLAQIKACVLRIESSK